MQAYFWENESVFAVEKEYDASWIQVLAVTYMYMYICTNVYTSTTT